MCVFQWIKVKWYFEIVFYHFIVFGLKNAKIKFLKENKGFDCSCFPIEVQVISNSSSRLEKKQHQTPDFCL